MSVRNNLEERDALYYPFIHIRDEAWLRNALLFFPHVLRMAPCGYAFDDSEFVRELALTKGRRGEPLVGCYPLDSGAAYAAGARLARRLEVDASSEGFQERYSRAATQDLFGEDSLFQIHRNKFADALFEVLRCNSLLWEPARRQPPHTGPEWFAVHPRIGEVVMSTAAAAAAASRGCDILTDTVQNHIVTATRDEDLIYRRLLAGEEEEALSPRKPSALEIGNLVIATTVDLGPLRPADFAAFHAEGEALFEFRTLLQEAAAAVPAIGDDEERQRRAAHAAERIVAAWNDQRPRRSKFFKRLFRLEAAEEGKDPAADFLTHVIPALAAGSGAAAVTGTMLAAAPGLAVGLLFYGLKTRRDIRHEERTAPTRFLSRVGERGGILAAATSLSIRS